MRRGLDILPAGCVCGHDHTTHRGEPVEMCLKCACSEYILRCQNCGGEVRQATHHDGLVACSARCKLQLQHAVALRRSVA